MHQSNYDVNYMHPCSIAVSTSNSDATAIGVAMALILLTIFAAITAVVVGLAVVFTKREKIKRLSIDEDIAGYDYSFPHAILALTPIKQFNHFLAT